MDFNPRSRKESDGTYRQFIFNVRRFQSTLSQGERPYWKVYNDWFRDISIHALARRATTGVLFVKTLECISIHALARRATHVFSNIFMSGYISIHALARRATADTLNLFLTSVDFNPRSRKESDTQQRYRALKRLAFQSTLSQGERPPIFPKQSIRDKISIHALARRATAS